MNDTQRYLTKLFLPKENICYTSEMQGSKVVPLEQALAQSEACNFVCLNPLDGRIDHDPYESWHKAYRPRRADVNVTARRNFLVEFDKIPLEEQTRIILDLDLPYTTLTFSGSKSMHAVISLTESVSAEDYSEYFDMIKAVIWQMDASCRNPSKLTRVPDAKRDGVNQDLIDVRKRIPLSKLVSWLVRYERQIEKVFAKKEEEKIRMQEYIEKAKAGGSVGIALLNPSTIAFLSGEVGNTSSRHNRLYAVACHMFEIGIDFDEVHGHITLAAQALGITEDRSRRSEAASIVKSAFKQVLRRA